MLSVECRGTVLHVLIDRPEKRNALSLELLGRIGQAFESHADDGSLQLAVLTGSGDRCFAAGGDLHELDAVRSEADTLAMSRHGRTALDRVRRFPVPVIAALNGHAFGGGGELAMACDLRVAVPHAEIGFLQAQLNVTTAWGGGIDVLAALGPSRGLAVLLQARRLSAGEALSLGLLNGVSAPGEPLETFTQAFIAPLLQRPVQVLRAYKSLANGPRLALHAQLGATEETGFTGTWVHADHWAAAARALAPKRV